MHSMLKSYQKTSNVDFYDNLHRKYFNKAKAGNKTKEEKTRPDRNVVQLEIQSSQIDETGLFDLTE